MSHDGKKNLQTPSKPACNYEEGGVAFQGATRPFSLPKAARRRMKEKKERRQEEKKKKEEINSSIRPIIIEII